ncbi:MAG: Sec-independent protein translocase protein TatB [Kiloniellales bacterium]|nr:Sec-independent protein translocase protein TatB [Kiloniellales bacterium]
MLDIGWSELAVVAVLALIVIGPKDLPGVMRTMGQWMRKARGITREFQSSIDEMVREAELEDARKAVESTKSMNVNRIVEDTIDPTGGVRDEVRDIEQSARETSQAAKEEAAPEPAKAKGDAKAAEEQPKATVIEHPVQVAPPHSLTPPAEAPAEPVEKAASGQKSA